MIRDEPRGLTGPVCGWTTTRSSSCALTFCFSTWYSVSALPAGQSLLVHLNCIIDPTVDTQASIRATHSMTVEGGDDHLLKWLSFVSSSRDPTHLAQPQSEIPWSLAVSYSSFRSRQRPVKLPGLLSASRVELCMGTDAVVPELDVTLVCIPSLRWCYTRCSGIEAMGWLWVDCVRQQDQRVKGWRWFHFVVSCVGVHFRTQDANKARYADSDTLRLIGSPVKSRRKVVLGISCLAEVHTIGLCVSRFPSEQIYSTERGKIGIK